VALDYRNSVEAEDAGQTENVVKSVQNLTVKLPDHLLLRRVSVDDILAQDPSNVAALKHKYRLPMTR